MRLYQDASVNGSIGTIEANDRDSGINGFVAYEQLTQVSIAILGLGYVCLIFRSVVFMVQPNGDVILLQSLDYETQQEYQITVNATVCFLLFVVYL